MRFWTEGFTSLDLGGVVVPWEALRQVEYIASGGSSAMVRFHLKADADLPIRFNPLALGGAFQLADGGARFVQIDVSPLRNGRARVLGAVARFAPDGGIDRIVPIPAPRVTSLAFGGADFRTVYVTTARHGHTPEEDKRFPQQGSLFAFEAPVAGLPRPQFAG